MTITSAQKDADDARRRFHYYQSDDAASPALILKYPGFRPSYVCVENVTTRVKYEWYLGMNQGDYLRTVAAGTRTTQTDDVLDVEVDVGQRPSITVAAAAIAQNDLIVVLAIE